MTLDPSDHIKPNSKEPPRLRSSATNRRAATSDTKAGVITSATTNRQNTTMTGVTAKITISGATTDLSEPRPTPFSHDQTLVMMADDSSAARTASMACSQ